MAIELVITQKGLFPKALEEADLAPAGLRVGHWNQAGALDDGPGADGRVLCDPAHLGRGLFVQAVPGEKKQVRLRQTVPCTPADLDLLYGLAASLCRKWKADSFLQDGETVRIRELEQVKRAAEEQSLAILRSAGERWETDGLRLITAARFPIYMEPDIPARFRDAENLAFFEEYLHRKQSAECYYAKPSFYRHSNGTDVMGAYTLTEGVDSIFPLSPFVPPLYYHTLQDFSLRDEQVTVWTVSLVRVWEEKGELTGNTVGQLPFADFARAAGLDGLPRFDHRHVRIRVEDAAALASQIT